MHSISANSWCSINKCHNLTATLYKLITYNKSYIS